MIGYLSFVRDTGQRCWFRADEVAAFSENTTKLKEGGAELVPCITVTLRNNVAWHIPHLTGEILMAMIKGVTGTQVGELRDGVDGRLP